MSVTLHTLTGMALPATHHAIENTASLGVSNGILYGLAITAADNNIIVGNGYGMICGRLFEIQAETIPVVLPSSPQTGQIILTLDLSLDPELTISYDLTGAALTQTQDAVYTDGIWQMQLCTFTADSSGVSDPVVTAPVLKGIGIVAQNGNYIKKAKSVAENLALLDSKLGNQLTGKGITDNIEPVCAGFVTNSKKNVEFSVTLTKPLSSDVSNAYVHGCYLTIRQGGNYIWGDGSTRKAVDPQEMTVYRTRGGLRVKWEHGSVINANAVNNDVCAIDCQIRFRFT